MVAMHLVRVASVLITWFIHEGIAFSSVDEASSNSSRHDKYSFKRNDARKEHLSELYFQNQLQGRNREPALHSYTLIEANYPCLYGVTPVGQDDKASAQDGHKFACGIHHIKSRPIVYSFGSNRQQDFEKSILFYRPDALVYTFEIKANKLPNERDPNIVYTVVGLGPTSEGPVKMMLVHEIMKMLNHTYVDVLKIDIEGGEHPWVKAEPTETFTRIGQLLLEVHNFSPGNILIEDFNQKRAISLHLLLNMAPYSSRYSANYSHVNRLNFSNICILDGGGLSTKNVIDFVESLEQRELRIFNREMNLQGRHCCCEFAMIRRNWGAWNSYEKQQLLPL